MKFIIVIKGVDSDYYSEISADIERQCRKFNYSIPVFAWLPGNEPSIEVVWTDSEMELKHLEMITNKL